jgi:myo-inositol 2-dehydrogenase/D-chiro-inositol 1-dehydrogenase
MTVRIALLGCGRIARLAHLPNLAADPRTELVAIGDTSRAALESAREFAPKAEPFTDMHRLFETTRPDGAVIALPTPAHPDGVMAALQSGAHAYLEKPIAATIDDAQSIHQAWSATELVGRIGFNARFNPLFVQLRDKLSAGEIGDVVGARTTFSALFPTEATWRLSPQTGGGALLELASHHVDLLRFILQSEVERVFASAWSNRGDDEAAMLNIRMKNGAHAQAFVAYGTLEEDSFEVYGTRGKLRVNRYDSLIVERLPLNASGGLASAATRMRSELAALPYGLRKRKSPAQEPSFAASLSEFVSAVGGRERATPDLTDGLRALEVIDAARKSVASGCAVEVGS